MKNLRLVWWEFWEDADEIPEGISKTISKRLWWGSLKDSNLKRILMRIPRGFLCKSQKNLMRILGESWCECSKKYYVNSARNKKNKNHKRILMRIVWGLWEISERIYQKHYRILILPSQYNQSFKNKYLKLYY